jgi:hypothetical protein
MSYKLLPLIVFGFINIKSVYADSGVWIPGWIDLYWNNNANWSGSSFPNGAGEVAAFIGQHPGTFPIDSTEDITLGSLHFDAPGRSISIAFASNDLIFESSGVQNQANIFIAKEQTHFIDTPIVLLSDLSIHAGSSASLYLNAPISGDHSVSIFVDPNTHINSNIGHSYTGATIVQSGWLDLNGPGSAINVPGDIVVMGSGYLKHASGTSNNYAVGAEMFLNGGELDLGDTTQTIGSLEMAKRAIIYGSPNSTLRLSDAAIALKMREDSLLTIDNIVIENGGAITNDPSLVGNGYFLGQASPQGHMTLDLNGNTVAINVNNGIYEPNKDIILDFFDVQISNGTLLKTGGSRIFLEGTKGSIPSLAILGGGVQIGRATSPAEIDSNGTLTIEASTFLSGFGSIGTADSLNVINDGFLIPGDHAELGTLTILGDYEQEMGGSLLVQGESESNVNALVVENGDVNLSGSLYFSALPNANYQPGDQVVLIDNTGGSITGNFLQFQANLPQGLSASLSYTSDQVIMNLSSCN